MKSTARVCSPARAGFFLMIFAVALGLVAARAQNEPILVPDAVNYQKLLPILPEPPPGWTADKPEGSTEDVGGFKITNVHRDYRKGEGEKAPTAAVSILDSVANPDYVSATTEAWKSNSESSEGYSKSVPIDGNPGFEAFEKPPELDKLQQERAKLLTAKPRDESAIADINRKIDQAMLAAHSTLWVMIANRYFLQIELQKQDPKELQEWIKRIDLKKLAAIK
jgi:hypothetical protein